MRRFLRSLPKTQRVKLRLLSIAHGAAKRTVLVADATMATVNGIRLLPTVGSKISRSCPPFGVEHKLSSSGVPPRYQVSALIAWIRLQGKLWDVLGHVGAARHVLSIPLSKRAQSAVLASAT